MGATLLLLFLNLVVVHGAIGPSNSVLLEQSKPQHPPDCWEHICVPKCCPDNLILDTGEERCVVANRTRFLGLLNLQLHQHAMDNEVTSLDEHLKKSFLPVHGFPDCPAGSTSTPIAVSQQHMDLIISLRDGQLHLKNPSNAALNSSLFCLEEGTSHDSTSDTTLYAYACITPQQPQITRFQKCCPVNFTYDPIKHECHKSAKPSDWSWLPLVFNREEASLVTPTNWEVTTVGIPDCKGPAPTSLQNGPITQFVLMDNGSLWTVQKEKAHPMGSYCLDSTVSGDTVVSMCSQTTCEKVPCVRKCCGNGAKYSESESRCILHDDEEVQWHPRFVDLGPQEWNGTGNFEILSGSPLCSQGMHMLDPMKETTHRFLLLPNGALYFPGQKHTYSTDQYCLDDFLNADGGTTSRRGFLCFPEVQEPLESPSQRLRLFLYAGGLCLSAVFLFATFLLIMCLPEMHSVHGKCQLSHVAALFFAYVFLAMAQFGGEHLPTGLCNAIGTLVHFFLLAAFFWLNVLCYNIWSAFREIRAMSSDPSREWRRFLWFSCYAWGCPLAISLVALVMDMAPEGTPDFLRPGFGTVKCWFSGNIEELIYLYGPVGILLIANCSFFVLTAKELLWGIWKKERFQKSTQVGKAKISMFRVCLKLFIVMGGTWLGELLSWAFGDTWVLWYVTDAINTLQGVLIFIVLACRRRLCITLSKRYRDHPVVVKVRRWHRQKGKDAEQGAVDGEEGEGHAVQWTASSQSDSRECSSEQSSSDVNSSYT